MNAIGQDSAKVRIVPELRSAIGFAQLNLIDNHYPVGDPMDVIFCRNVLIYFNKHTQVRVVSQLVDKLRPGGFIMLGHGKRRRDRSSPALCCQYDFPEGVTWRQSTF
jgi:chemotaxis protein methyltransferase CheR